MQKYKYGQVIEYIDSSEDKNYEDAKHWAFEHNATFKELFNKRTMSIENGCKKMHRFFKISEKI